MSQTLGSDDPQAVAATDAIRNGDLEALRQLLQSQSSLASARIRDDGCGGGAPISRTLLHVATDWPGHLPGVGATIRVLVEAGANVNARNTPGTETPLHWAASADDLNALDALVERGADIEAPGAVIAGGTPLDDAVAFGQWRAAHRLVELSARTALWHAAALGLLDRVEGHFAGRPLPGPFPWGAGATSPPDELTVAFWCACHGGQPATTTYLLGRGADLNWMSVWDHLTPLDTASREGAHELVAWLRARGAKTAEELTAGPDKENDR